jgi:hypothetical protein
MSYRSPSRSRLILRFLCLLVNNPNRPKARAATSIYTCGKMKKHGLRQSPFSFAGMFFILFQITNP